MAFVFASCGDDGGGGKKEEPVVRAWATVFDMQDSDSGLVSHGIQELAEGDVAFPAGSGATPISPLVKAGNMPDHISSFKVVTVDGKKALEYVTVATWGPGFDLPNSAFAFFGGDATYAEGDTITITGTATGAAIDLALNINQGGAQNIAGGNRISTAGDFEVELTLTAADIDVIKGNEQNVIRFEDRKGATTVTITNIVIEGYRPVEVKKLATPVTTLTGSVLSWDAVSGAGSYKLLALAEGGTTPTEITLTSATVSYDLAASSLAPTSHTQTAVTYSLTLVAIGVPGVTTDSDPSAAKSYTKNPPAPPPSVSIKIGGVDKTAELYAVSGTFVEIKDTTDATKTVGYTFTKGAAYQASYAYLKVDLGTAKLSDYSQVKFKYAGVSGDLGYKDLQLNATATEPSGALTAPVVNKPRYDTWATYEGGEATGVLSFGTGPQVNNADNDGVITLKVEPTLASTLTGEIYVSIYFGAAATGSFGGAGSPTVFSASEFEFITADATNPITHDVYLTTKSANGIILGVVNVADNATIASVALPQTTPTQYNTYYTAFIAEATSITGWKNKADDSDFVLGTTTVTKDTVLYAIPGTAVAEFDLAALEALAGGITLSGNGASATFDATTKVIHIESGGSVLFYFTFTDAGITPAAGETLKITYACVSVDKSDVTVKNNANAWADTNPAMYPTFTPSTTAAQTHELTIPVDNLAAAATGVSFQNRNNSEFYLKIISVVSE
jgi:hypothetical protein